jgi:hypothetical protein
VVVSAESFISLYNYCVLQVVVVRFVVCGLRRGVAVIYVTVFGCHSAEASAVPKTPNVLLTVHHNISV